MYNKRGQVTLFVILAILLVGIVIALTFLIPRLREVTTTQAQNPEEFIRNCIEDKIKNTVETLCLQGGELAPTLYYAYEGNNITYLCYNTESYAPCVMQQVFLKEKIKKEILDEIKPDVDACFNNLTTSYRSKGYEVKLETTPGGLSVDISPQTLIFDFGRKLTLTRNGESQVNQRFRMGLDNNLYELIGLSESILQWEARYGDSELDVYRIYYRDYSFNKLKQEDGTTIYILTNKKTKDKFQFASRSIALPPGY